jgi:predicted metal-dependent hydrolase
MEREDIRKMNQGVAEFNAGMFFECHDTLEDVWHGIRGPSRDFFQGLIQVAVGFYHLGNDNRKGGRSQLEKGLQKLETYGDSHLGIELKRFRREVSSWLDRVRRGEDIRCHVRDLPKLNGVTGPSSS